MSLSMSSIAPPMPSMLFKRCGPTYLVVHAPMGPRQAEWEDLIADQKANVDRFTGILVAAVGGIAGPNARQRREWTDMWQQVKGERRIACVTESMAQRSIVTAFNWVLPYALRVYSPGQIDDAFDYLGTPSRVRDDIRGEVRAFAGEIGIPGRGLL